MRNAALLMMTYINRQIDRVIDLMEAMAR